MRQESNQCVSDFITNLNLAIQDCGYKEIKADNFEHAMLVQQLTVGLRHEKARENLLTEKKDLSWEKAYDIASHQERVRQNLQQLNQSNDGVIASLESEMVVSLVNTAVSSPRQRPSVPSKQLPSCYRCGQHHIRWSDCRHQKTVCQFCKKIGHIERVCFSKRRANANTHATYPNPAGDGEAILRMFSANALLQSPYTITLPVDHHPVKFEIDTGSAVTLINEASLQKLPSLLPASSTFRSYTGQNVEVQGVFTAEVEHGGELHYLSVHVVRGSQQPNLLGRNWIKCVPSVLSYVHRIGENPALDLILVNHKDLFRDDSATHYRGPPVKFQFQSDFRPRFFKARTVPYAVAPKVEEELDRLQKADIIEPVQYSEWAAPIVPVLKSDGSVRICGDYKLTINSATKLNPYPLPRIEDLYASLAGGPQFTTLDLKHAYSQVVLDTESREATTINTHRGVEIFNLPGDAVFSPQFVLHVDSFSRVAIEPPRALVQSYTSQWAVVVGELQKDILEQLPVIVGITRKLCIEVTPSDKIAYISEELCIGCGICLKNNLETQVTHRYGPNSFKLHRLPMPRPGEVLGLVGTNGIGKSTALKVLASKLKPNLGRYKNPPDWTEILIHFRGSELQNYFTKILEDNLKAVIKPQYVDQIPKVVSGCVKTLLSRKDDHGNQEEILEVLDLKNLVERDVTELSGGELQRFAIAMKSNYVVVVEHDLSVLDYLSDFICCLYGVPGAYGVVTMPFSVREGINIFLDGMIPTENMRFRDAPLVFKVSEIGNEEEVKRMARYEYPSMTKTLGSFKLKIDPGTFTDSEIIVMLGENGTGKTTFIRMLAGNLKPDEGSTCPPLNVSYKPQKISPKSEKTVQMLLYEKIRDSFTHPQFSTDVLKPLQMERLYDQQVMNLSGGELQRLAITLCLGQPADVYLIDEPSAYLDSEQRLHAAKVIKRYIMHAKKTAFVVEHDFIMATYLADRVVVFEGTPGSSAIATSPQNMVTGMNRFLQSLDITFRRDSRNARPRINKLNSVKDVEQKRSGNFFFLED
ncbi:ATP-binding cassette sub- E member 1 [Sparganum proliferum]